MTLLTGTQKCLAELKKLNVALHAVCYLFCGITSCQKQSDIKSVFDNGLFGH